MEAGNAGAVLEKLRRLGIMPAAMSKLVEAASVARFRQPKVTFSGCPNLVLIMPNTVRCNFMHLLL